MFLTPSDIISSALRLCGVIGKSEVPANDEMVDAMQAMNLMIEQWSARRLAVRGTTQISFPLTAGKYKYTIGLTGDVPCQKPLNIASGFTRDYANIDMNLALISIFEYNSINDKMISSARPMFICYDPGYAQQVSQVGAVSFYPIPDYMQTYTAFLNVQFPLTDFLFLTDSVTFEPMYGEALKYGLAIRLWREYHNNKAAVPADIVALYEAAMTVLEKNNHVLPVSSIESPTAMSVYNIYSDSYR